MKDKYVIKKFTTEVRCKPTHGDLFEAAAEDTDPEIIEMCDSEKECLKKLRDYKSSFTAYKSNRLYIVEAYAMEWGEVDENGEYYPKEIGLEPAKEVSAYAVELRAWEEGAGYKYNTQIDEIWENDLTEDTAAAYAEEYGINEGSEIVIRDLDTNEEVQLYVQEKDNKAARIRYISGLNRRRFCDKYHIPYMTYTKWERDEREAPEYVMELLERCVRIDFNYPKL